MELGIEKRDFVSLCDAFHTLWSASHIILTDTVTLVNYLIYDVPSDRSSFISQRCT